MLVAPPHPRPFQVVAEHILLAAKLAIGVSYSDDSGPSHLSDSAEAHRRKYLLGVHGLSEPDHGTPAAAAAFSQAAGSGASSGVTSGVGTPANSPPRVVSASASSEKLPGGEGGWRQRLHEHVQAPSAAGEPGSTEPRLLSVFPKSGPCASGAAVSLRGERLGSAVSRGELTLLLALPKPGATLTVPATFVSERKVTCVLPPAPAAGFATIELLQPDAHRGDVKGGGARLSFRYCSACTASRLRPSSGPVGGGTPVRMLGGGFVPTDELTVCLRLHGVERRVPAAFVSAAEVRFLAPSFAEAGDAKVQLSLNGQEYEPATEILFTYTSSSPCVLQ